MSCLACHCQDPLFLPPGKIKIMEKKKKEQIIHLDGHRQKIQKISGIHICPESIQPQVAPWAFSAWTEHLSHLQHTALLQLLQLPQLQPPNRWDHEKQLSPLCRADNQSVELVVWEHAGWDIRTPTRCFQSQDAPADKPAGKHTSGGKRQTWSASEDTILFTVDIPRPTESPRPRSVA